MGAWCRHGTCNSYLHTPIFWVPVDLCIQGLHGCGAIREKDMEKIIGWITRPNSRKGRSSSEDRPYLYSEAYGWRTLAWVPFMLGTQEYPSCTTLYPHFLRKVKWFQTSYRLSDSNKPLSGLYRCIEDTLDGQEDKRCPFCDMDATIDHLRQVSVISKIRCKHTLRWLQ